MNIYEGPQNGIRYSTNRQTVSDFSGINAVSKSGKHLKRIVYVTGLAGILFCFNGCFSSGYVTSEPSYVQHSRPPQPSNLHVWIDGDWGWSRPNHVYIQKSGYWTKPVQGRTYKSGSWKATPKGHSYKPGRWEKKNR